MADAKKAGAKSQAKGNNPKAEGKGKSKKGDLGYELAPDGNPDQKKGPSRLRVRYQKEILPALMKELGLQNPMEVPRVTKVVVNMGLGYHSIHQIRRCQHERRHDKVAGDCQEKCT